MKYIKLLIGSYFFIILLLFLYSYTQVDLSLTLSRFSIWQVIEKSFQYIGYFMRPISTYMYIAILVLLFIFYIFFLRVSEKLKNKQIWIIVFFTSIILTFSYSAFSYDIFNYIFDAKIITYYHLNPYQYKALDFPADPMLSFMHWTHRTYPYGPTWLGITVPFSLLGLQFFLPTFFLFKLIGSTSYVICIYFIQKILEKYNTENTKFGVMLFAVNPLVLIEGMVTAHNEMPMIALLLGSIYLFMIHKCVRSFFVFLLSVGIKFASAFLIPVFIFALYSDKIRKKINWDTMFIFASVLMIVPTIAESFRGNFQPWYVLNILPLASLIRKRKWVTISVIICSFASLCTYIPFLYTGNWDPPIPLILGWIMASGVGLSILVIGIQQLQLRVSAK